MRIGYTSGVFDVFHTGHLNLLRRARLDCDFLFAGVCSDEVARELTGSAPRVTYADRLAVVRSMEFVDAALGKFSVDPIASWQQLRFDVLYKGGDWAVGDRSEDLEAGFALLPVEVVYFPFTHNASSLRLGGSTPSPRPGA